MVRMLRCVCVCCAACAAGGCCAAGEAGWSAGLLHMHHQPRCVLGSAAADCARCVMHQSSSCYSSKKGIPSKVSLHSLCGMLPAEHGRHPRLSTSTMCRNIATCPVAQHHLNQRLVTSGSWHMLPNLPVPDSMLHCPANCAPCVQTLQLRTR